MLVKYKSRNLQYDESCSRDILAKEPQRDLQRREVKEKRSRALLGRRKGSISNSAVAAATFGPGAEC